MKIPRSLSFSFRIAAACLLVVLAIVAYQPAAHAIGSPEPEQSGSVGLEGKISSPPPTQAATISTPRNGQSFTNTPITVAGLCKTDLLVKIFSNNVFVGSAVCKGGSYSLQVGLFNGKNDLVARVYDSLDQAGPDSNVVTVTFVDPNFTVAGSELTLTSNFARRGANPGTELTWPIVLSGGAGPYALSVDWGDASGQDLQSLTFAGNITLKHTYKQAGVYSVIIKATDHTGQTAYLQVVAVANGEVSGNGTSAGTSNGTSSGHKGSGFQWYVFLAAVPLLLASFWLGSRNELYVIRKRLDRARGTSTQ